MKRGVLGVVVVAVASGVCVPQLVSAKEDKGPGPVPVVDCESRIQVIPPAERPGRIGAEARRASIFAGPVMFLGAKSWRKGSFPPRNNGKLHAAKMPLIVDAGSPVTVSVESQGSRTALLEIGLDNENPPSYSYVEPSIELEPCDPSATVAERRVGKRTPFLGGILFEADTCVDVTAHVEGESEPHRAVIGLGRRNCAPPSSG